MKSCNIKLKIIFPAIMLFGLFGWAKISEAVIFKNVDFETGDISQTLGDSGMGEVVPSDLPGGGNYSYRITLPAGYFQDNCGFVVDAGDRSEIYVRWYAKFETDWRFSLVEDEFKFMFIEPNGSTPGNGRTFLNANTINSTSANLEATVYSHNSGAWLDTGRDATNDGLWHAYEVRSKRNISSPNLGAFQVWIDGILTNINLNNINAGNVTIDFINFCYRNGSVPTAAHIVFDEIIISDQYIGPINGPSDTTPPAAPQGLSVN